MVKRRYISLKELIDSQKKIETQLPKIDRPFNNAGASVTSIIYEKRDFAKEFQVIEFEKISILFVNITSCTLKYTEKFSSVFSNLIQSGKKKIIVDFSEVCIIDSTFIGVLVKAFRTTLISGGIIKLVVKSGDFGENTPVKKSLERVFNYFTDIQSCMESFEKPGSWNSLNTFISNREINILNN
jgi:anti-anti-sigma regulatory factor